MAVVSGDVSAVRVVLLGAGYTLQRVAAVLPAGSFVVTSRDGERCAAWRACGWCAEQVRLSGSEDLQRLFEKYPNLDTLVDSVPPERAGVDPTAGVQRVVSALRGSSIQRVVYLSTTGVFGRRDGSLVDERTEPAPWNEQGAARWLCEQAYRTGEPAVTALRLPAIYGPGRGVRVSLRAGTYRLVGDGSWWTNRIHVDDLVQVVARCIASPALPDLLCVGDDHPAPAREVVEYICRRDNLPWPPSISEEQALAAGAFTMLSNQRIVNTAMKERLGITLRYPSYREGLYAAGETTA